MDMTVQEVNELWKKVAPRLERSGDLAPAAPKDLRGMLEVEWDMAERYRQLAARMPDRGGARGVRTLYEQQMELVRRVAAVVYMQTGEKPARPEVGRTRGDIAERLRDMALWENRQAAEYRRLFSNGEAWMKELMFTAAKRKEENALALKRALEDVVLAT